jgi:hypothetical protein
VILGPISTRLALGFLGIFQIQLQQQKMSIGLLKTMAAGIWLGFMVILLLFHGLILEIRTMQF